MGNEPDDPRERTRRGSEHVRIKGTTEELGEIVPPQVVTRDDDEDEGTPIMPGDDTVKR